MFQVQYFVFRYRILYVILTDSRILSKEPNCHLSIDKIFRVLLFLR